MIYPDWLVLSARLLVQPSCGQVKIVQYIYICLVVFPCSYVRILLPIAIYTVIFVTQIRQNLSPAMLAWGLCVSLCLWAPKLTFLAMSTSSSTETRGACDPTRTLPKVRIQTLLLYIYIYIYIYNVQGFPQKMC